MRAEPPTAFTPLPTALTLANPPTAAAPTNVQINQITANWIANGNPVGTTYVAQISADSGFNTITSSTTFNTYATFTGLSANTTYYMRVEALNAGNTPTSFTSLPSALTLANPPIASAPTNVQATQITANWIANGNPAGTSYVAQISADPGFSSLTSSGTTSNIFLTLRGLAPNTTYYMRVQAINYNGVATAFIPLPSALTLASPPGAAAPTNVLATQITANWIANGNPAGTTYIAQISIDPGFGTATSSVTFNTFATFSGLSPNIQYFMQVQALNAGSLATSFTPLPSVTTSPNPPGPAVFSGITANQLQANWTANGNPPGTPYQAILSTGASPSTNVFSGNASSITFNTSALFSVLAPNTLYFVDVQVFNGIGSSIYTPLGSAATLANTPVAAAASGVLANQITANWTANGNPAGTTYVAQISIDPGFGTFTSSTTSNTFATFNSLSTNTTYYMRVQAISQGGTHTGFTPLPAALTLANPPGAAAPTNILATQITANWNTNGNPVGTPYIAQISPDPGFITVTSSATTNTFATFTGLSANATYYMRVQSLNAGGAPTAFTPLPSALTLANPPGAAAPANVQATQITANWIANGNPDGTPYIAQISLSPSFNSVTSSTTSNSFATFAGLSANTTYYMRVQSLNAGGAPTAFTPLPSALTLANPPGAAAPTNILATQITANWTTNGNPIGTTYVSQISADPGFITYTSSTTTNILSLFTNLVPNTTYYMRVLAVNVGNASTPFMTLPSALTLASLPTPAVPSVILSTQITANWAPSGNPAGTAYVAQISPDAGFSSVTSSTTFDTFATFIGLSPNTTYYTRVQAVNSAGASTSFVSLPSALTLANPPTAAAPTNVQINQITANWSANANPAGTSYTVQISTDAGFTSFPSFFTTTLSFPFTGLLPNTTYFMRVQATNSGGHPTAFTLLPSTVTFENAPAPPGGAQFTNVSSSTLQANWTTSGNPADTLYHVILSTGPSPSTNGYAGNQSSTTVNASVLFSGLLINTVYFAEVNATTSGGISVYTNLTSISTLANPPTPADPTNIQISQVTANWGANGNPLGTLYNAQMAADIGFTSNVVGLSTTALSGTFTSLSANTSYYMRVQAQNQNLVPTSFALLPSTTTLPNVPGPVGFNGITPHQLQANWTSNGNRAGTLYLVILSTGPSPSTNGFGGNQSSTTARTSLTFSGLSVNTRYFVDIAALNSISNSVFVGMGPVSTLANPPTLLTPTSIQSNQITANWGANGNPPATTYFAQASADSGFITIADAITTTLSSATFTGLAANTTYFMQVRALNLDNTSTAVAALPSAKTLDNPAAPPGAAGLTIVTSSQLQANWTTNGNPAGTTYTAVLSSGPSPSTNGYTGNQSSTTLNLSAVFTGLSPDTFYYVEVRATNSNGSSSYTSLGFLPTFANPPAPANPSGIGPDQITARWSSNGNPGDTVYLVQIGLSPTSFTDTEATISTYFTFTGLAGNTTYYMQVKAINRLAQSTTYTALPPAQTVVGTPGVPVLSAAQISDSAGIAAISWQWTTVLNALQYHLVDETGAQASPIFLSVGAPQWQETCYPAGTCLIPNTRYERSVVAVNTVGEASTSTLISVYTLARQPTGIVAQAVASNSITIGWNSNGNPFATEYTVQMSMPDGTARQTTVTALQATFDQLAGATTYYFTVKALNGAGTAAPAGGRPARDHLASAIRLRPNLPFRRRHDRFQRS
jgi:hypothetical protein